MKSLFVIGTHIDIWPGPPFMSDTGLPIRQVEDGTYALVLDICMSSFKVVVDGTVGWVDRQDIDSL